MTEKKMEEIIRESWAAVVGRNPNFPCLDIGHSTIQGADLVSQYQTTGRMIAVAESENRK